MTAASSRPRRHDDERRDRQRRRRGHPTSARRRAARRDPGSSLGSVPEDPAILAVWRPRVCALARPGASPRHCSSSRRDHEEETGRNGPAQPRLSPAARRRHEVVEFDGLLGPRTLTRHQTRLLGVVLNWQPDVDFWRHRRVAVTGATGFLGSHLTAQLVDLGADVVVLVRDDVPPSPVADVGRQGRGRARRRRGPGARRAAARRVRGAHACSTSPPRPRSAWPTATRSPPSRPTSRARGGARGRPPLARRRAGRDREQRQGLRRAARAALRRGHAAARRATPTTCRRRAPTSSPRATTTPSACRCASPGAATSSGPATATGSASCPARSARCSRRAPDHPLRRHAGPRLPLRRRRRARLPAARRGHGRRPVARRRGVQLLHRDAADGARARRPCSSTPPGTDLEPDIRGTATHEIDAQFLSAAKARKVLGWAPHWTLEEALGRDRRLVPRLPGQRGRR